MNPSDNLPDVETQWTPAPLPPPPPAALLPALITADALTRLEVPQRPKLLGEWLREGDYGLLFAPRGHGKTWLAMLIGKALALNEPLGLWTAGELPRRVVYFDAEMNLPDVKERARLLSITGENFVWLQHERVFDVMERNLNIAAIDDQSHLDALLNEGDVLIVDNLSTASTGMDENDNNAFDCLVSWFKKLRRRHATVIMVHHAGRNGQMRGASRREDMAHWILRLTDDSREEGPKHFVTVFQKCRNCQPPDAQPLKWTLDLSATSEPIRCQKHLGPDALLGHIREGVGSATELAQLLGVEAGTVSKWAKKLMERGLVTKKGRDYAAKDDSFPSDTPRVIPGNEQDELETEEKPTGNESEELEKRAAFWKQNGKHQPKTRKRKASPSFPSPSG